MYFPVTNWGPDPLRQQLLNSSAADLLTSALSVLVEDQRVPKLVMIHISI